MQTFSCGMLDLAPWPGTEPRPPALGIQSLNRWITRKVLKLISLLTLLLKATSFVIFSSVQSLSRIRLFATLWIAACQASLSITNSQSSLKLMSIKAVIPSNHLILCHPLLLLSSIFPSIWVFSNESALRIRWPKYWCFSFNISPSSEHPGLISLRMD